MKKQPVPETAAALVQQRKPMHWQLYASPHRAQHCACRWIQTLDSPVQVFVCLVALLNKKLHIAGALNRKQATATMRRRMLCGASATFGAENAELGIVLLPAVALARHVIWRNLEIDCADMLMGREREREKHKAARRAREAVAR